MGHNDNRCNICGAIEPLPYRCKRCGGVFCGDHRLPEKHYCDQNLLKNPSSRVKMYAFNNSHRSNSVKRVRKKPFSKQIRRLARLSKRIINSGSFSVLLIISIILIAGAGYYVYLFDPNTVTLMDGNTYYSNSTGYQMKIHNNPTSHNPTYQELINFVVNDNTDKIHYTPGSFVCIDYSVKLHDNAEKANITAGVALYKFSNNVDGHACDVFNTTDRGMVYIDCTGGYTGESMPNWDKEVIKPSIGSLYTVQPVTPIGNYYYPQENWMISESIIFW